MKLTTKVVLELASHEALVREMYLDSVGVKTWGVGVTSASGHAVEGYERNPTSVRRCMEIYVWLLETKYLPAVVRAFKGRELEEHELAAALSFHYNTGAIGKATWVRKFLDGDRTGARKSFLSWNKPPEIKGRRLKEADLFFKGQWSSDGKITEYKVRPNGRPDFASAKRIDVRQAVEDLLEPKALSLVTPAAQPQPQEKPVFNTNAIHNILNVAIAALAALLVASGCTTSIAGSVECSQSWLSPQVTSIAIMAAAVGKSLINVFRDGLGGLFKAQPPVK